MLFKTEKIDNPTRRQLKEVRATTATTTTTTTTTTTDFIPPFRNYS